ncbi:MAG: GspE/PulE family protein [bacterium]
MLSIPTHKLRELIIAEGLIEPAVFDAIVEETDRLGQNVADTLITKNIIDIAYYSNLLSRYLDVPLANLGNRAIDTNILHLLPEDMARQKSVIVFGKEVDGAISAAMEDPSDLANIEFLERYFHERISPYIALEGDLSKGFALYSKETARDYEKLLKENIAASLKSKSKGEEAASEVPIVAIVDNIISYAISLHASDIHLEIFESFILIRYRIDGILREIFQVPRDIHPAVVARIKLLGGLKIDEHAKPQDGRFRYQVGNEVIDMRVAAMPTFYGEKIVMRLLPSTNKPVSLEELGMFSDIADVLKANIQKSYGLVLVTGPTGSGKTTTLYSLLHILNKSEVNIVTIEDPIEYDMKYVNQSQINTAAGITFSSGLRQFLRQDPDIIMVGEIRDGETASIAVQAALTGHLVLSTLHTNDAPTAVPRFLDLGVPPFLLSAVLNVILAQRLVRKVCQDCIYSYAPTEDLIASIEKQIHEMGIIDFEMPRLVFAGKGCDVCGGSGYRGRLGIYEVLNVDTDIRSAILDKNVSIESLRNSMRAKGAVTMFQDGLRKVAQGLTTIEEVLRVIRE